MLPNLTQRAFRLMGAAPLGGCLVEFGVYKGDGLLAMSRLAWRYLRGPAPPMYGFDSFAGMPPTTRPLEGFLATHWRTGAFADTSLGAVQARLQRATVPVTLVQGVFADLRPLADYGVDRVRFAHVDADIYEGYRDALRLLTPHLQTGTVLLFDESVPPIDWRFQCIRHHGRRAVREWEESTGMNVHVIRSEGTVALCVLVDDAYLRRWADLLLRLRRDTLGESLRNIARITVRGLAGRRDVFPRRIYQKDDRVSFE